MLPPPAPTRRYVRQSNNALVILALLLGLILGATAVGMIWFLSGHTTAAAADTSTEASRDAWAACALLVKVPSPSTPDFAGQGGYQLAGAASLAEAATAADPHYRALSDALTQANDLVGQYPVGQRASAALANARAACAEI